MKTHTLLLLAASALGATVFTAGALATEDDSPAAALRSELGFDGSGTLVLQVTDLEASMNWYRDTLGFEHLWAMEELAFGEVQSSVPGLQIGMSEVPEPKTDGPAITFGVTDIEVARKRLEKASVEFDGETTVIDGVVKLAYFKDPSGNQLVLHQSLAPAEPKNR